MLLPKLVALKRFMSSSYFCVRDLRVNLRGGNGGMSHHMAYRLYRDTQRESDVGSVIMPGLVEGQINHSFQFFVQHDKITASVNVEHLVSGSLATVLLYDLERNIQQTDRGKRIGLWRGYESTKCRRLPA